MRWSLLAALTLTLAAASPAYAAHHLMQVTEVAPGGTQAEQFIELFDPQPEGFPLTYSVAATDGSGTVIPGATQELDREALRDTATTPYVLGGTSVVRKDIALEFPIPQQGAQICFYADATATGPPVNCLNYGNLAIPAGQSAQRQSCGVVVGAPSPDERNPDSACGGGGGGGGTGGGGDAEDLTRPQQKVAGRRRQDVDRLAVTVTLDEAGTVTARGRVNVPGAARVFRFRPVSRSAAANQPVRLRLRLAARARRAVKAALNDGRRLRARIAISARDDAGNPSTSRRTVRLTD